MIKGKLRYLLVSLFLSLFVIIGSYLFLLIEAIAVLR